jgi:hypothetical protein
MDTSDAPFDAWWIIPIRHRFDPVSTVKVVRLAEVPAANDTLGVPDPFSDT